MRKHNKYVRLLEGRSFAHTIFWVLLPIHCDGLAFASSNALDGSQACAPMVIASDRNGKPKCMTGWLVVDKIDLGQVEKSKATFHQLMGFLFAAISSEVRSGEVKHFHIFNEDPEETWFSVRSGEIVLAIDQFWRPNIPSTYHFLGVTATYFCQSNLFNNGKEVLRFKNADVHKPSSCCISTRISHTSKQRYMPLLLIRHCTHCTFVRIDVTNDSKTFWNKRLLMLHCLEGKNFAWNHAIDQFKETNWWRIDHFPLFCRVHSLGNISRFCSLKLCMDHFSLSQAKDHGFWAVNFCRLAVLTRMKASFEDGDCHHLGKQGGTWTIADAPFWKWLKIMEVHESAIMGVESSVQMIVFGCLAWAHLFRSIMRL